MIRAVFEGDIPSWSNPTVRTTRLAQWVAAGLNAVVLQVDIGFGATWPSTLMRQDPRIEGRTEPLRSCVDACHAAGLSVVLDFACASYNALAAIHPEYLLPNYFMPYYNYWDAGFQAWRSDSSLTYKIDAASQLESLPRRRKPSGTSTSPCMTSTSTWASSTSSRG
jgi:hypothetical protein